MASAGIDNHDGLDPALKRIYRGLQHAAIRCDPTQDYLLRLSLRDEPTELGGECGVAALVKNVSCQWLRIPAKAATRSGRKRPAIPIESGRPARSERSDDAGSFI